jgi:hypothetical protein
MADKQHRNIRLALSGAWPAVSSPTYVNSSCDVLVPGPAATRPDGKAYSTVVCSVLHDALHHSRCRHLPPLRWSRSGGKQGSENRAFRGLEESVDESSEDGLLADHDETAKHDQNQNDRQQPDLFASPQEIKKVA